MIDLVELETFVVAVHAGSFARAARQLGLSPAMVGRRIQALEAAQGTRLIERTTRAQRLTEIGEAFLKRAELVLDEIAELEDLAHGEGGDLAGRIRATMPTTLGIHRMAAAVAAFCAQHPRVQLEISLTDRRVDLISEGFDLAVRIGTLPPSNLVARQVGLYPLSCVAAPAYASRHGLPGHPEQLGEHACLINLNMSPRGRWPFFSADGATVIADVDGQLLIDNGEAQLAAALAGAGICYLPLDLTAPHLSAGRLLKVLPDWQTIALPINFVMPSRQFVPRRLRGLMASLEQALSGPISASPQSA